MSAPTRHERARRRPAHAEAGYTAVEVLMAMTVMAIGAAAVISMQRASVQGNLDARETDIANSLARTWVERIHREAMQWTIPGRTNPTGASNLATSLLLSTGVAKANSWFLPDQLAAPSGKAPVISPGFDILGRDVPEDSLDKAFFCTHLRFVPLDADPLIVGRNLYRVDVRVLWARGIATQAEPAAAKQVCAKGVYDSDQPDPVAYHAIYLTTAVQGNPQ